MNANLLGTTSVGDTGRSSRTTTLPQKVREALEEPESLAWFEDAETGQIIVVNVAEICPPEAPDDG